MGAVNPVSGSSVALWEAGNKRLWYWRDPARHRPPALRDGSFGIALTCPSASAQIYLTAQGGDAGGGSNSSLMLMAALGRCGSISVSTPVIINEVTTAGSVYALAQFLSTTSSGTVGAPSTNATGLCQCLRHCCQPGECGERIGAKHDARGSRHGAAAIISTRLPTRWGPAFRPTELPRRIARSCLIARCPGRRSVPGRAAAEPGRLRILWRRRCRSH